MDPIWVGLAIGWIAAALGWILFYRLTLQYGRLLLKLESLEDEVRESAGRPSDESAAGLPVGTVVNDFELPLLSGGRMTLSQSRGRQVVLIFFDPRCAYSRSMLPKLSSLALNSMHSRPAPIILTTGDPDENRELFEQHAVRCPVLLQDDMEVAQLYRVEGTPMAYLIDEQGRTASPLAVGAEAVLALAGGTSGAGNEDRNQKPQQERPRRQFTRSLSESRINREGLKAGMRAPDFRLPRLDGGELALEQFRGRKVLLVFSDPVCAPCNELAPELEKLHRGLSDRQVLMVSRGDPAANRAKVAEQGLTFPVVLQKHWEISRAYGMLAAPIGYLVDEQGVIERDVAVGGDAILELAKPAVLEDG